MLPDIQNNSSKLTEQMTNIRDLLRTGISGIQQNNNSSRNIEKIRNITVNALEVFNRGFAKSMPQIVNDATKGLANIIKDKQGNSIVGASVKGVGGYFGDIVAGTMPQIVKDAFNGFKKLKEGVAPKKGNDETVDVPDSNNKFDTSTNINYGDFAQGFQDGIITELSKVTKNTELLPHITDLLSDSSKFEVAILAELEKLSNSPEKMNELLVNIQNELSDTNAKPAEDFRDKENEEIYRNQSIAALENIANNLNNPQDKAELQSTQQSSSKGITGVPLIDDAINWGLDLFGDRNKTKGNDNNKTPKKRGFVRRFIDKVRGNNAPTERGVTLPDTAKPMNQAGNAVSRNVGKIGKTVGKFAKFAGPAAAVLNIGMNAFDMFKTFTDDSLSLQEKAAKSVGSIGSILGGAIGMLGGPIGVWIGSEVGEALGKFLGENGVKLGKEIHDILNTDPKTYQNTIDDARNAAPRDDGLDLTSGLDNPEVEEALDTQQYVLEDRWNEKQKENYVSPEHLARFNEEKKKRKKLLQEMYGDTKSEEEINQLVESQIGSDARKIHFTDKGFMKFDTVEDKETYVKSLEKNKSSQIEQQKPISIINEERNNDIRSNPSTAASPTGKKPEQKSQVINNTPITNNNVTNNYVTNQNSSNDSRKAEVIAMPVNIASGNGFGMMTR